MGFNFLEENEGLLFARGSNTMRALEFAQVSLHNVPKKTKKIMVKIMSIVFVYHKSIGNSK